MAQLVLAPTYSPLSSRSPDLATTSPITLGKQPYSSLDAVKKHVHEIIEGLNDGEQIEKGQYCEIMQDGDRDFLFDLFSKHQKAADKLSCGQEVKIWYGANSRFKGRATSCFYVEQEDGTKEEISYLKCFATMRDEIYTNQGKRLKAQYDARAAKAVEFIAKMMHGLLLSQGLILQTLTERFPYKKSKAEQQYLYFKMMLDIAVKHERAEEQILATCIDKLLQLDADILNERKYVILTDSNLATSKHNVSSFLMAAS
jgi:hypothetical protein